VTLAQAARRHAVPDALLRHRAAVDAAMREAVSRLAPEIMPVVAYHLGWRDADGRDVEADGGKAVRPAIVMLGAEAVGGAPAPAVSGAVALELIHNFSLIHDDVMDGDRERRHRPTVWAMFGVAEAIVAGDALHALAHELLLELPADVAGPAALELERATADMIRGQAEDLAFESRLDVDEAECVAMSAHKTGALLGCAGALGAMLGGGTARQVDALRAFGRHLGVAFQAVDDVLGIWGDPAVTGKPAASDLRQHKKTLPIVHALRSDDARADDLARGLANGSMDDERAGELVKVLDHLDARRWTAGIADRHLAVALGSLDGAALRDGVAAELRDVARFVTRRDF
jgi:geranylgeranyl diphosphate synthase, type I